MPGQPSSELDTAFIRDIAEVKSAYHYFYFGCVVSFSDILITYFVLFPSFLSLFPSFSPLTKRSAAITSHQSETLEEYRLAICTTFEHAGRASVAHKCTSSFFIVTIADGGVVQRTSSSSFARVSTSAPACALKKSLRISCLILCVVVAVAALLTTFCAGRQNH